MKKIGFILLLFIGFNLILLSPLIFLGIFSAIHEHREANSEEIREKKGISQLKLSSISGVCKSNIGAIEVGTIKKPSFIDILKLSKALEVNIKDLYEEKENS